MVAEILHLDPRRHADDLRLTWQARVLGATLKSGFGLVIQSVIAETFDADVLQTLLFVIDEEFDGALRGMMLCSRGRIDKRGRVVADVIFKDEGWITRGVPIFKDEIDMRDQFRWLADKLHLNDRDRLELFFCVRRWCPSDMRIDPLMDPWDPDAKRLRIH